MSEFYKPDPKGYEALRRGLAAGLLNVGFAIEEGAKVRCPYKTGNLRRSIHTAGFQGGRRFYGSSDENGRPLPDYVDTGAFGRDATLVVVGTNAGYGVFVELGTVRMPARPYLGPALADARGRAQELFSAGMQSQTRGVRP